MKPSLVVMLPFIHYLAVLCFFPFSLMGIGGQLWTIFHGALVTSRGCPLYCKLVTLGQSKSAHDCPESRLVHELSQGILKCPELSRRCPPISTDVQGVSATVHVHITYPHRVCLCPVLSEVCPRLSADIHGCLGGVRYCPRAHIVSAPRPFVSRVVRGVPTVVRGVSTVVR